VFKEIIVFNDKSCDMAYVTDDGECIMEGNLWDFHTGCHGIDTYGNFNGCLGLALAVQNYYIKKGYNANDITISHETYKYIK